ncbi:ribonuclease G [Anoxybacter fermentans]|uniref:Ribonuclease G n=1 Tax=Anoxybacter fermentans TaxID=1323375 RepID=A0A3S9SYE8_9FIRM|nr:Rne/Rng family ribonuclease [Anoxybacter fermentans]AZR73278.1 ribonuclease G [Anoxybacter fermentans]
MSKEIIINVESKETRVAVLEDRRLEEIYYERDDSARIVGNIYKGRVADVLPGMQAAFVDVGLGKNVFLHVSDALSLLDEPPEEEPAINHVVHPGQEIMVQIIKEPLGGKGARATCNITLPGRYLVLMTKVEHIGISRRVESEEERKRLKKLAEEICPEGMGLIVRTVAEGKSDEEIKADLDFLCRLWKRIQEQFKTAPVASLIHSDLNLVLKVVRDFLTPDVAKVVIDSEKEYKAIMELVNHIVPDFKSRIYLYDRPEPIFDFYGIETEINKALQRKVWLDCGGYIVFDPTEALTSIDVNTGKYVGKTNLEDTVLKTNLEAAKEIARQLKLRDIGGIIIIDFIDMDNQKDQDLVLKVFEEELKKDKTRSTILGMTHLGLVEMTRKKVKQGLEEYLQSKCPYCGGKGRILSEETVAMQAVRKIKKVMAEKEFEAVLLGVHPDVASLLIGLGGQNLAELEQELKKEIYVKGCADLHREEVKIIKVGSKQELAKLAVPVEEGQELMVVVEEAHQNNPDDGIARIEGYILDIQYAGKLVNKKVKVRIENVYRTYARASLIS